MVKNPREMQETRVQFLGWEDPLEKGMATHSSILVWRIPWTEDPGRLQSLGSQSRTRLSYSHTLTYLLCVKACMKCSEAYTDDYNIIFT